jgi:hypothetical protein
MAHIEDEEYTYVQPPVVEFVAKCMYPDRRNANGIYYPREVIEKAVAEFQSKINQNIAVGELNPTYIVGEFTHPSTNLDRVSHKITSLSIGEECCVAEGVTLNTPLGKILQQLLTEDCTVGINPCIMATVSNENVLDIDAKIIRFDIAGISSFANDDNRISLKE